MTNNSDSGFIRFPAGRHCHIAVFDDLIPGDICDRLVLECEKHKDRFEEGETISGRIPHIKSSLDLPVDPESAGEDWWDDLNKIQFEILEHLIPAFNYYVEQYDILHAPVLFFDTGFRIQFYAKGNGYYRKHVDSVPWVRENTNRIIAMVIYLNTVDHGGGTHFPLHEVTVEAKKGRVAMFPASWTIPHQGLLPISGDKWIINTFIVPDTGEKAQEHFHGDGHSHDHEHDEPITMNSPPPIIDSIVGPGGVAQVDTDVVFRA